jgi:hypothetical protein
MIKYILPLDGPVNLGRCFNVLDSQFLLSSGIIIHNGEDQLENFITNEVRMN